MFTSFSKNPAWNLPQGHGEAEEERNRDKCDLEKGHQPLSEGQTLQLRESWSSREMGLQGECGGGSSGGRGQRPHGKNLEWKRRVGERGRSDGKGRKKNPGDKVKENPSCEVAPGSIRG